MTKKICVILTILFSSMLLALMSMLVIHSATNISVTDDVDDTGVEYIASTEDESYNIFRSDNEPIAYPDRVGYMFIGWYYDDGNGVMQPVDFGKGGDVTGVPNIYAKYETATSELIYEYDAESSSYKVVGCSDTSVTKLIVPDYYNDGTNGKKPVTAITSNLLENEGTYNTSCKTIFVGNEVQKIDYLASTVSINEYNMIVSSKGCTTLKNIYIGRGLVYISTASIIGCENVSVQIMARNTTGWEWRAGLASNGREPANISSVISYANFQHSVEKKQYNAILGRKDNSGIYDVHIVYILDGVEYEGDPTAYDKTVITDAVGTITEINEPLGVVYKADYYFDGWYTKASCNLGSKVTFPHKTVGSVTFYPKFIPATNALSYGYDSAKDCYYVLSNGANLTDTTLVIPDYHSDNNVVKKVGYIETPSKEEDNLLYEDQIVDTLYIGRNVNNITDKFAYSSVLTSINYGYTTATNKCSDISIGNLAFMEIPITQVKIPTNVISIGANPFAGCSGLTSITVDDNNPNFEDRDSNVVVSKEDKNLIIGCNRSTLLTTDTDITEIGDYAFYYCTGINEFVLPSGLIRIGNYALYSCSALNITSLDLPDSLTCIGEYAFYNCKAMSGTILTIPSSVTSMGAYAFAYCEKIETLNYEVDASGNCLLSGISEYAFYNCSSLSYINPITKEIDNDETIILNDFPNNITVIGSNAFYGCTSLKGTLSFPSELETIGDGAFRNCNNLTGELLIPNSVKEIGQFSFSGCGKLTDITLGNSVKTIAYAAFRDCVGISAIHIPASVTSIDGNPFDGCSEVTSITVDYNNTHFTDRDSNIIFAIHSSGNVDHINRLHTGCNNSTIPNDTRYIGALAFRNCTGLTSITIPKSVYKIETNPFAGCYNIESIVVEKDNAGGYTSSDADGNEVNIISKDNKVISGCKNSTIPGGITDGITEIGSYAFYKCIGLKGEEVSGKYIFTLPDSVETIGEYAFYGCEGIKHLKIGDGIKTIADGAFGNCKLTGLEFAEGVTVIGRSAFSGSFHEDGADIFIPYTVTRIGSSAFAGSNIKSLTIQDEEGDKKSQLQHIQTKAFDGCRMLTGELVLPASITGIADYAFHNTALTSVTFKDVDTPTSETGVSIGRYAFANNNNKSSTRVYLGNNIKEILQSAFMNCSNLAGPITIPAITTFIGGYCFEGANITELKFEGVKDGTSCLTTIGTRSFYNNANLSGALIIPASVKTIGEQAFYNCSLLESIEFVDSDNHPSQLQSIGNYAFQKATSLTTVGYELKIPASVVTIGSSAFSFNRISNIIFSDSEDRPSKLQTIGTYAFLCNSETPTIVCDTLIIPDSVTTIGYSAFSYADITNLHLGENVQSIGSYAFYSCKNLAGTVVIPNGVKTIGQYAFRYTQISAIVFVNTTDWKKASNESFTSNISSVNVADPLKNATWLTSSSSYYTYYWKRS